VTNAGPGGALKACLAGAAFTTVPTRPGRADGGLAEAVAQGLVRGPRLFPLGSGAQPNRRARRSAAADDALRGFASPAANMAPVCPDRRWGSTECRRARRRRAAARARRQIKIMASARRLALRSDLENLQYQDEEMRAIVEEARTGIPTCCARPNTPEAIRRGRSVTGYADRAPPIDRRATRRACRDRWAASSCQRFVTTTLCSRFWRDLGIRRKFRPRSAFAPAEAREAGLRLAGNIGRRPACRIGLTGPPETSCLGDMQPI